MLHEDPWLTGFVERVDEQPRGAVHAPVPMAEAALHPAVPVAVHRTCLPDGRQCPATPEWPPAAPVPSA